MWLVKNGVPFDVAFTLEREERFAYGVIFGIFEGNKFNVDTMRWETRK